MFISSTPINATEGNNKYLVNQNNKGIDFKLKFLHPFEETYPQILSASSKILLSLKTDDQIFKTYGKLRKQIKKKIHLNHDYKTIAKIDMLLVNTESNLKNELSH